MSASSASLVQPSDANQAHLYDALLLAFPDADHTALQRIATSACRAVYFLSPASDSQASTRFALFHLLRSVGASLGHEELEAIHKAVLEYNKIAKRDAPSPPAARPVLPKRDFDALCRWNAEAAASFDQIALTSHAGTRHVEPLPGSEQPAVPTSTTASIPSSSTDPPFSPSWLRLRCTALPTVKTRSLTPSEMALSVHTLLADTTLSDEAIQEHLFDAFGGDFDAVVDVLSKRAVIQSNADAILADCNHAAELEELEVLPAAPRQRGVAARRERAPERERPSAQVTIRDRAQEALQKGLERESRRLARAGLLPSDEEQGLDLLQPSLGGSAYDERQRAFPGVQVDGDSMIGAVDRVGLPKGSTRDVGKGYEEIFVPPPVRSGGAGDLVEISSALSEHPELLQAMRGVSRLNRLQSAVYPVAFHSDENLLVCAPTGAGKTNVALLTILREIVAVKRRQQKAFKIVYVAPMKALAAEVTEKFGKRLSALGLCVREFTGDMSLSRSEAMETHVLVTTPEKWDVVTRKSGSELGDAVTLFIIDEIHLLHDDRGAVLESIVARTLRLSETAQRRVRLVGLSATLPNYADVGSFMRVNPQKGLFHFDGGHRPVPLSQTFIGISEGGNSNANEARRRRQNKMHEMAWRKVKDSLQRGHQAMIFVHSRKGTSSAAREMLSRATQDACESVFLGAQEEGFNSTKTAARKDENRDTGETKTAVLPSWAAKEISKSRTADIRELCARGVGIHNAGLPRAERKLVERLFAEGVLRLLCCTATLAWGINLPARTVVIMGTEVYSAEKGGFVQLGMLDVMQIFGRAGRPQFDTEGEGTIITMHEHLGKYLSMLTSSIPIESKLGASASRLADHLNAEIISGTVSSIGEGVRWLSYTYLSVRMPKNPLVYGIDWAEVEADNGLHSRRASLIEQAAKALDDARMCRYDPRTGVLAPTDLGRVSSHFYVSHETVVLWNEVLGNLTLEPPVTDEDWDEMYGTVIHAISSATEFEQMRSRQEEAEELDQLTREACPLPLKAGSETREGKVAILLQSYISRALIRMSDLSYIVESATRLLRAFFEISLRKGLPSLSLAALELARASESRIWPFQHPLWQFTFGARRDRGGLLQPETVAMIESYLEDNSIRALRAKTKEDLSVMIRAPKMVSSVQRVLKTIPTLEIESASVAPLSRSVLSIDVRLFPNFKWNDLLHGRAESWWLWVEDLEEDRVYHSQKILLTKRQVQSLTADHFNGERHQKRTVNFKFTVPVFDPPSGQYWVRIESERWHTGRGSRVGLSLASMDLPMEKSYKSTLLDLRPLSVQEVLAPNEVNLFEKEMTHLTPVQTQAFHVAYHSNENMLLAAPPGSGMEVIADFAILSALRSKPSSTVIYLSSDIYALELQRKRMAKFEAIAKGSISLLDHRNIIFAPNETGGCSIALTTPERWYIMTREWKDTELCKFTSLLVLDELHLLLSAEGDTTELLLTRFRQIRHLQSSSAAKGEATKLPRVVALSGMLPNAAQVGDWLGVSWEKGLFCFGPEIKEVPCESQVFGVAGDRYSSRMHSLNRPLFATIQRYSMKKPVLIFVASRRQALLTAQDLVRMASLSGRADFLGIPAERHGNTGRALRSINDMSLQRSLSKGIALYHEKMSPSQRNAIEELYKCGHAQIMISTFRMARAFNMRSHQVIVKGTECFDQSKGRYEDVPVADILHMIGRAGRPRTDSTGYAIVFVHEPKKTLVKKILHEPLPLESRILHIGLPSILNDLISSSRVCSLTSVLDWFSRTLLFRRLDSNPGYYGMMKQRHERRRGKQAERKIGEEGTDETNSKVRFCERIVLEAMKKLEQESCIVTNQYQLTESSKILPSVIGHISAAHNILPQSARYIADQICDCLTVEATIHVVCGCEELVVMERQETDEKVWRYLLDVVTTEFCEAGLFKNRELAAQGLGITGWIDSPLKRTKLLCYSLLVDAKVKNDTATVTRELLYEKFSRLLCAGFEIASELGSLSGVRAFVFASQSLYQGVPPQSDIWVVCGSENEELNTKGRKEGWSKIGEVIRRRHDFNVFVASNSRTEVERSTLSRRLQRYPQLTISRSSENAHNDNLNVDVTVKRTNTNRVSDCLSRLTSKREGGYILIAASEATGNIVSVQRFAECVPQRDGANECIVQLTVPVCTEPASDLRKIRVWVASDVLIGIEAEAVLSCTEST